MFLFAPYVAFCIRGFSVVFWCAFVSLFNRFLFVSVLLYTLSGLFSDRLKKLLRDFLVSLETTSFLILYLCYVLKTASMKI